MLLSAPETVSFECAGEGARASISADGLEVAYSVKNVEGTVPKDTEIIGATCEWPEDYVSTWKILHYYCVIAV